MRYGIAVLVSAAWLVAAAAEVSPGEPKRPNSLDIELSIVSQIANTKTGQSTSETVAERIQIRAKDVRREQRSVSGTEVVIEAEGYVFLLDPDARGGLRRKSEKEGLRGNYPEFFDAEGFREWIKQTGGKKTGSARVNGVDCDLYTQMGGKATLKRWVRKDNGQPVRTQEVATATTGQRKTTTITMKRVKVGDAIADSVFQAPKGYKVEEVKQPTEAEMKAMANRCPTCGQKVEPAKAKGKTGKPAPS